MFAGKVKIRQTNDKIKSGSNDSFTWKFFDSFHDDGFNGSTQKYVLEEENWFNSL